RPDPRHGCRPDIRRRGRSGRRPGPGRVDRSGRAVLVSGRCPRVRRLLAPVARPGSDRAPGEPGDPIPLADLRPHLAAGGVVTPAVVLSVLGSRGALGGGPEALVTVQVPNAQKPSVESTGNPETVKPTLLAGLDL